MGNEADDVSLKLLNLPHYVLRILFSYLDATSLYLLSQTCSYLKEFIEDSYFWKYVDARKEPNTNEKVQYCTERIHDKTTHLFLKGIMRYGHIPSNFFDKVSPFANLRVLALENQKLYGAKVSLKDFPIGLEELSLRKSYVKNSVYFFQHSARKMQKLRVLILDECSWVTCSFLLSVSKYENLEIISAVKCLRAHLNMVPYLNVAKYGCKKLKVLDCRFTGIGGELLRTFYSKQSIQNLYFQSFKSAIVDYEEKGSSSFENYLHSSDTNSDLTITDYCLTDYSSTTATNVIDKIHESVLYQDPYPECSCGYKEMDSDQLVCSPHQLDDDYVYIPPAHQTTKFVCQKHMKDVEQLPNDFKDFFVLHQRQFHSDVTSDAETDPDSSGSEDDRACCIYAMGTKMVILPNMHNLSNRSEMDLPGGTGGVRNDVPFNIFIVNTLGDRNNPAPSTERPPPNDEPSTSASSSNNNQKENQKKALNEKILDDSSDESELDSMELQGNRSNLSTQKKGKRKYLDKDDGESDYKFKKKKVEAKVDTNDEDNVNKLIDSAEDVCNRLNIAIENGIETISKRYIGMQSNDQIRPSCSTDCETDETKNDKNASSNAPNISRKANGDNPGTSNNNFNLNVEQPREQLNNNNGDSESEPPRVRSLADRVLENLNHYGDRSFVRYRLPVNAHWPIKRKISLRRLSLRGYKRITDVTLTYIRNLDIDLIDLTYTSVTKHGIEDFLVHNPNCRIIHPLYCICKPRNPF